MARAVALAMTASTGVAHAQERLVKGPWLMDLHPGSVVVMAERRTRGPLSVLLTALGSSESVALHGRRAATVPPAPMRVDDASEEVLHEVHVTGLSPGVRYRYEVSGAGITPVSGVFCTAPILDVPFRFVVYGDTRTSEARHTAAITAITREAPDFVLHTGDMVADGTEERLWQEFFDIERPLLLNTPMVPVVGNHEIIRPFATGLENYRRYIHVDPTGPRPELDYAWRYGGARFIIANAYDDWTGEARTWIEQELTRARRESPNGWLFVAMHWGPRSAGPHGNNPMLHDAGVDELFRRARVDLVIAGHDHDYERGDDAGLRYLVSGGAGAPLYRRMHAGDNTRMFAGEHHYVTLDVERARVLLTARRLDGTLLDRVTLTHDGWREERSTSGPPRPSIDQPDTIDPEPDVTTLRAPPSAPLAPPVRATPWMRLVPLMLAAVMAGVVTRMRKG